MNFNNVGVYIYPRMKLPAFLCLLVLVACTEKQPNKKMRIVPKKKAVAFSLPEQTKEQQIAPLYLTCEVKAPGQQVIEAPFTGILLKGEVNWSVGTLFRKGDLLLQFDNAEAFARLHTDKLAFQHEAAAFGEQVTANDLAAWQLFLDRLSPAAMLPALPQLSDKGIEQAKTAGIIAAYQQLSKQEQAMRNYFMLAETDGWIAALPAQPGNQVKKQQPLLVTVKSNERHCYLPAGIQHTTGLVLVDKEGKEIPIKGTQQGNKVVFRSDIPPGTYQLRIPA